MTKEQLIQYMADNYPVQNRTEDIEMIQKQMNIVAPKIETGEITTTAEIDNELA